MPVHITYLLECDRIGCGSLIEQSASLNVPSQHVTGPTMPVGWQEYNGELRCPDCQDCTDGDT